MRAALECDDSEEISDCLLSLSISAMNGGVLRAVLTGDTVYDFTMLVSHALQLSSRFATEQEHRALKDLREFIHVNSTLLSAHPDLLLQCAVDSSNEGVRGLGEKLLADETRLHFVRLESRYAAGALEAHRWLQYSTTYSVFAKQEVTAARHAPRVAVYNDEVLSLWSTETGKRIWQRWINENSVWISPLRVELSPTAQLIAIAGQDWIFPRNEDGEEEDWEDPECMRAMVLLLDGESGELLATFGPFAEAVPTTLVFSPDERYLLAGCDSDPVRESYWGVASIVCLALPDGAVVGRVGGFDTVLGAAWNESSNTIIAITVSSQDEDAESVIQTAIYLAPSLERVQVVTGLPASAQSVSLIAGDTFLIGCDSGWLVVWSQQDGITVSKQVTDMAITQVDACGDHAVICCRDDRDGRTEVPAQSFVCDLRRGSISQDLFNWGDEYVTAAIAGNGSTVVRFSKRGGQLIEIVSEVPPEAIMTTGAPVRKHSRLLCTSSDMAVALVHTGDNGLRAEETTTGALVMDLTPLVSPPSGDERALFFDDSSLSRSRFAISGNGAVVASVCSIVHEMFDMVAVHSATTDFQSVGMTTSGEIDRVLLSHDGRKMLLCLKRTKAVPSSSRRGDAERIAVFGRLLEDEGATDVQQNQEGIDETDNAGPVSVSVSGTKEFESIDRNGRRFLTDRAYEWDDLPGDELIALDLDTGRVTARIEYVRDVWASAVAITPDGTFAVVDGIVFPLVAQVIDSAATAPRIEIRVSIGGASRPEYWSLAGDRIDHVGPTNDELLAGLRQALDPAYSRSWSANRSRRGTTVRMHYLSHTPAPEGASETPWRFEPSPSCLDYERCREFFAGANGVEVRGLDSREVVAFWPTLSEVDEMVLLEDGTLKIVERSGELSHLRLKGDSAVSKNLRNWT